VDGPSVSMPQLLVDATRLEGDDRLVVRSVRPSRVVAAAGMGMVNTSILGRSTQGAAPTGIEAGAPELHFLRAIQIRQQHNIVTPGSTNHSQAAASTDQIVWSKQSNTLIALLNKQQQGGKIRMATTTRVWK
jgi:E3 ubiquitin-protein ligase RNF5